VTDHPQKGRTDGRTHTHTQHTHTHTRSQTVEPRPRLLSILCTHFTTHTLLRHKIYYKHFTTHTSRPISRRYFTHFTTYFHTLLHKQTNIRCHELEPITLLPSILYTLYYTLSHFTTYMHIRCHEQWNRSTTAVGTFNLATTALLLLCFTAALLPRYYTPHTRSRTVEPRTLLPSILSMTSFSFTPPAAADPPISMSRLKHVTALTKPL
jgi:hypothetical protein